MIPRRIIHATQVLRAPLGWDEALDGPCNSLSIRVIQSGGYQICESAWEPTPEELAALAAGASVILRVVGGQPPVMLYVEPQEDA